MSAVGLLNRTLYILTMPSMVCCSPPTPSETSQGSHWPTSRSTSISSQASSTELISLTDDTPEKATRRSHNVNCSEDTALAAREPSSAISNHCLQIIAALQTPIHDTLVSTVSNMLFQFYSTHQTFDDVGPAEYNSIVQVVSEQKDRISAK